MGVVLSSAKWREWRSSRTNLPVTLRFDLGLNGMSVSPQAWGARFALGNMNLTDVLIQRGYKTNVDIILGTEALKRLDLIVDGKHGVAWLRPKTTAAFPPHERLGAVFVPRDPLATERIAHVAEGSPAAMAGLLDGDILLKIGDRDVANSLVSPASFEETNRLLDGPEGSPLELTVRRGSEVLKVTVVLNEIFGPNAK